MSLGLRRACQTKQVSQRLVPIGEGGSREERVGPVGEHALGEQSELFGCRALVGLERDGRLALREALEEGRLPNPAPAPEKRDLAAHPPELVERRQLLLAIDEHAHLRLLLLQCKLPAGILHLTPVLRADQNSLARVEALQVHEHHIRTSGCLSPVSISM